MSNIWDHIAYGCLVALAAVFTLWGGSLLFRALDGDRFSLRGRTQGRWFNRVSRRILCIALLSIIVGGGLAFVALVAATNTRHLLWHAVSTGVATLAVVVLAWSWAGRRSAGRPRCPTCMYDVSAVDTDTCPECGFVAQTNAMWHKPRKRKRGLCAGGLLVVVAAAMVVLPLAVGYGWRKLIPTNVMIAGVGVAPDWVIGTNPDYYGGGPEGSLAARVYQGNLTWQQMDRLCVRLASRIAAASDADDLLRTLTLVEALPVDLAPEFTEESARRFVERVLLGPAPRTDEFDLFVSRIDWSGLSMWQGADASNAADLLIARATAGPDSTVNTIRWIAAATLSADPVQLLIAIVGANDESADYKRQLAAAEVVRSMWNEHGDELAARLWESWLIADDEARARTLLRILGMGAMDKPAELPAELRSRVWLALLDRIASRLPPPDDAASIRKFVAGLEYLHLREMLRQEDVDALEAAMRTGSLTRGQIALLATARFNHDLVPPNPLLLTALIEHEDPLVRAAAGASIELNQHEYALALIRNGDEGWGIGTMIRQMRRDPASSWFVEPPPGWTDEPDIDD